MIYSHAFHPAPLPTVHVYSLEPEYLNGPTLFERITALLYCCMHALFACCLPDDRAALEREWRVVVADKQPNPNYQVEAVVVPRFFTPGNQRYFNEIETLVARSLAISRESHDQISTMDRVAGLMTGHMAGGAIGIHTQLMFRAEAEAVIALGPLEMNTRYTQAFRAIIGRPLGADWRRDIYPVAGGTEANDQAIIIYRLLANLLRQERVIPKEELQVRCMEEIVRWSIEGVVDRDFVLRDGFYDIRERGEGVPGIPRGLVGNLLLATLFRVHRDLALRDPFQAATENWLGMERAAYSQDECNHARANHLALARGVPLVGLFAPNQKDLMIEHSVAMAEITHADPRAIASSVAANVIVFNLIHHPEKSVNASLEEAYQRAATIYQRAAENLAERVRDRAIDIMAHLEPVEKLRDAIFLPSINSWEDLQLGELNIGANTYTGLSMLVFGLKEAERLKTEGRAPQEIYRTVMTTLVSQAGYSDNNGTLLGSLLGAYLGYDAIPPSWRTVRDQHILHEMITRASPATS